MSENLMDSIDVKNFWIYSVVVGLSSIESLNFFAFSAVAKATIFVLSLFIFANFISRKK